MTKEQALYQFWSSFGIPAYAEGRVPTGNLKPGFPYITFQVVTDSFGAPLIATASIWDRDSDNYNGELQNNIKAKEISEALGLGGSWFKYEGGALWIQKGHPFAQSMGEDSDDKIRRKLLNVAIEFMSE